MSEEQLEKLEQELGDERSGMDKEEIRAREGLHAYALRQAAHRQTMLARFSNTWKDIAAYTQHGAGATGDKFERIEYEI